MNARAADHRNNLHHADNAGHGKTVAVNNRSRMIIRCHNAFLRKKSVLKTQHTFILFFVKQLLRIGNCSRRTIHIEIFMEWDVLADPENILDNRSYARESM